MLKLACLWLGLFCAQKAPIEVSEPDRPKIPIVVASEKLKINITPTNYNDAQKRKLGEAVEVLTIILNSDDFRQAIISKKNFTNTMGRNGAQIYEHLMSGQEIHNPTSVGSVDFNVTMYYSSKNVVGYTYSASATVFTNSKYYDKYTKCDIARNLGHEWTHQLGYVHSTAKDSNSIPYSVGNIINDLCKQQS